MKNQLKIYGPAFLLVLASFVVAFQFIKPAPPRSVTIASGGAGGAYNHFAQIYAQSLAREGIHLEVLETDGSVDNIALLRSGKAQIALVQSGIPDLQPIEELRSLGSLYYEPVWLFHRQELNLNRLSGLAGLRVATGRLGSGTHALVQVLLQANELTSLPGEQAIGGKAAANALLQGDLDAAFFVSSPSSELINTLMNEPSLRLASFERAEAYARRFPFLSNVTLPEGTANLRNNIPASDTQMLAPAANLVVRADLHPAIMELLLQAAQETHSGGGWFSRNEEFPQTGLLAYPLADEARRFYENGPPFLQRYLPFWAASLIDRLKVMLLPLVLMLLPFFKIMPPIYAWRMDARVYRWYEMLEKVEQQVDKGAAEQRDELAAELDRIENEVRQVNVPLSFTRRLYHLRQHIDLVRVRLRSLG